MKTVHPLLVRITHWVNALAILAMSFTISYPAMILAGQSSRMSRTRPRSSARPAIPAD